MTKNVKRIDENQTIQTVCKVMHDNNIGSLVVVSVDKNGNLKPAGMKRNILIFYDRQTPC
jgi:predicted transcriptional regulator